MKVTVATSFVLFTGAFAAPITSRFSMRADAPRPFTPSPTPTVAGPPSPSSNQYPVTFGSPLNGLSDFLGHALSL